VDSLVLGGKERLSPGAEDRILSRLDRKG